MARNLEWHAANGDIIRFGPAAPFLLDTFDPGTPGGIAETARAIRMDGQSTYNVAAEPLTPTMSGTLIANKGKTAEETQRNLDNLRIRLQAALNPKHFGTLIYSNFAGSFRLNCRPVAGAVMEKRFAHTHKISVDWISDAPYWTEAALRKAQAGRIRKLWRFPWSIKPTVFGATSEAAIINNPTSMDIYPVIEITETRSERIIIGNKATGDTVTITQSIGDGETLRLDMAEPSAVLIEPDGGRTDVVHWTTADSIFPLVLRPGNNIIYVVIDNPELPPIITVNWHVPRVGI